MTADSAPTPSEPTATVSDVLKSYRYLRLSIVVVVAALGVSVGREVVRTSRTCFEGSLSAYYYTQAHSIFVGALIAVGVAMIAIKGRTRVEDTFLNVAGVLAPIVALVPTTRQNELCDKRPSMALVRPPLVDNAKWSLLGAVILTVGVSLLAAKLDSKRNLVGMKERAAGGARALKPAIAPTSVLATGYAVSVVLGADGFSVLHFGSAVGMFIAIWIVVLSQLSEGSYKTLDKVLRLGDAEEPFVPATGGPRGWYKGVAWAMPASALLFLIASGLASWAGRGWKHPIFFVEAAEIILFGSFWTVQTVQRWSEATNAKVQ